MTASRCSKKPLRIVYVIGSLAVGGAERHVASVAAGLRERGLHTTVFALSPHGPLLPALAAAGVPVIGPVLPRFVETLLGRRLSVWVRLPLAAILLAIELLRHRRTVVHFFLPVSYILGGVVACLVGARPRIMSRRSLNRYQTKHPRYRKIEHFLHPRMDFLVGNSLAVVRELEIESNGKTPIRLIYNGIDSTVANVANGSLIRRSLGLGESTLVIVIVANLIPYKGHADLLHALAHVKDRLPNDWCVMCIGRDDGILLALKDLAHTLHISTNVHWLGARMDVPDCLAAADIAVSASHEEGFSNAVLEAMLAGLPMVVTDVGGNAEAVIDGVTGFVVPAHSPVELGLGILRLADNPKRGELGEQGRACVIERFSIKSCLDAYESLYDESNLI